MQLHGLQSVHFALNFMRLHKFCWLFESTCKSIFELYYQQWMQTIANSEESAQRKLVIKQEVEHDVMCNANDNWVEFLLLTCWLHSCRLWKSFVQALRIDFKWVREKESDIHTRCCFKTSILHYATNTTDTGAQFAIDFLTLAAASSRAQSREWKTMRKRNVVFGEEKERAQRHRKSA